MSEDLTHADTPAASGTPSSPSSGPDAAPASSGTAPPGPAPGASAFGGTAAPSGSAAGAAAAGPDAPGGTPDPASAGPLTPEAYQPFTLPPEMAVDDGLLGQFRQVAAGLGLTQQQAQQLIDLRVQQARQETEAHTARTRQWAEAARRDPEFGGAGFETALAVADRGLASVASPDLRALLDQTGLGNHPDMIRLAYRIGRTLAEPGPVQPGATPPEAMSTAEFYAREVFGPSA